MSPKSIIFLFLLLVSQHISAQKASDESVAALPDWAVTVGSRTKPSGKFKADVTKFGAVGDGQTLCTKQIQAAIDACAEKGGGCVEFPQGVYLTGALFVKSNVEVNIGKNATLFASSQMGDFPEIPTRVAGIELVWPSAIINVIGQKNVAITGEGSIDGNGKIHWDRFWEMHDDYNSRGLRWAADYDCKRPRSLLVSNSEDITISGLTFLRAGFWTVQLLYSTQCTVSGLTIRNNIDGYGPSTDGINIDSSDHILVERCDVDCNDDNICLKAGRDADGLRVNRPTEYVLIRNCTVRRGGGLVTCGSETSGSIRHIYCTNCNSIGTYALLHIKSAMTRGGTVEDIYINKVTADSVSYIFHCTMDWFPVYSYTQLPSEYEAKELPPHWKALLTKVPIERGLPTFRNIFMSNITGTNAHTFLHCVGSEKSIIDGITLNDFYVEAQNTGEVRYTRNFSMNNVQFN